MKSTGLFKSFEHKKRRSDLGADRMGRYTQKTNRNRNVNKSSVKCSRRIATRVATIG